MRDPQSAFDRAFVRRAPALGLRVEHDDDADFLNQLFTACSPLAGMVPDAMLAQQAAIQRAAYASEFLHAMRRIVTSGDTPIGRAIICWRDADSHLVDIAVLPDQRHLRAGRHLLHAWLEIADSLGQPTSLEVRADNPAIAIYRALGFEALTDTDPYAPMVAMRRDSHGVSNVKK